MEINIHYEDFYKEDCTEVEHILLDALENINTADPNCNAYPLQEGPDEGYWEVEKTGKTKARFIARGHFNGFRGCNLYLHENSPIWRRGKYRNMGAYEFDYELARKLQKMIQEVTDGSNEKLHAGLSTLLHDAKTSECISTGDYSDFPYSDEECGIH